MTPQGLNDVYIHPSSPNTTQTGNTPLFTMSKVQANTTPLALNHTGLFPSVTVSFNLAPNVSLSDATLAITEMQEKLGTPATVRGFFAGTLQAYQQSLSNEWILAITAVLAVYIVPEFTRAWSTRSRSFRRCRRPASAPCSLSWCSSRI